ncbi:NAD(P)-dependent oxidoreductase [Bdellovibrionota bacterium FG-1]
MAGKKILITGAAGFIGSRLLPFLIKKGHEVIPSSFDLLDFEGMDKAFRTGPWDVIIHLAGISHVPACEKNPGLAFQNNLTGTALLLEAIHRHCPQAWLVFASSAQVYATPQGDEIRQGVILDENRTIVPQNTYARTKWQAELLIQDAARRERMKATVLRLFNHTHKSQSPDFFLPHLYQTIKQAGQEGHKGQPIQIPVGNLNVSRDIGSVQDLLDAVAALIGRASPPEKFETFNVCSGSPKHLATLADQLAKNLDVKIEFITDPSRVRKGEPEKIQGSHARLTEATGWAPRCSNEQTLLEMFLSE